MEITDVNTLFGAYPSQHPDTTADTLVAAMQRNGVQWCLTLATWGLFHSQRDGNEETLRACRAHQELLPAATINPKEFLGQIKAIENLLAQGFEMIRFFPEHQGWPIEFSPFRDVVSILAGAGAPPVMVDIAVAGDITKLMRIVEDYAGAIILAGVDRHTLAEAISVMRSRDKVYLETHALRLTDGLAAIRDSVGVDRILFGSEAPGSSLSAAMRYVRSSNLTPEEQDAVLGGNAMKVWKTAEG